MVEKYAGQPYIDYAYDVNSSLDARLKQKADVFSTSLNFSWHYYAQTLQPALLPTSLHQ